jgi:hypothetical protein
LSKNKGYSVIENILSFLFMTRYTHFLAYTCFPAVSRQRNFQLRFISLSDAAAYELFIHNLLPRSVSTTKFPTSFYQPVGRCGLSTFNLLPRSVSTTKFPTSFYHPVGGCGLATFTSKSMYEVSILFCLQYTNLHPQRPTG